MLKNGTAVAYGERGAGPPRAPPVRSRTRRSGERAPFHATEPKASGGAPRPAPRPRTLRIPFFSMLGLDRHLDRTRRLVRRRPEAPCDLGERGPVRDNGLGDVLPLPSEQVETDVEVGPRSRPAVDEGADQPELLREDEEGREGRRPGEGAEDADRPARPAGSDRGGEGDARRHAETVPGRHLDVLGEAPRDRHADHADFEAALILTGEAVATAAARGDALERDRIARLEARHAGTDLCHLARDLVARTDGGDHHLVAVPVEVRATDAAVPDAHHYLARSGRRT